MPPVEAMACGAANHRLRRGSLPEVTGGAALVYPVDDEAALAQRIVEVLSSADKRRELGAGRPHPSRAVHLGGGGAQNGGDLPEAPVGPRRRGTDEDVESTTRFPTALPATPAGRGFLGAGPIWRRYLVRPCSLTPPP
jgi:hypothetical protein